MLLFGDLYANILSVIKMKNDIALIVERLKECIDASHMSYLELEKKTGIAKSSINRYANGETKKIPVDAIQAIATAVGVDAAYIMGWDVENNTEYSFIEETAAQNERPLVRKVLNAIAELDDENLQKALDFALFLTSQQKKEDK